MKAVYLAPHAAVAEVGWLTVALVVVASAGEVVVRTVVVTTPCRPEAIVSTEGE